MFREKRISSSTYEKNARTTELKAFSCLHDFNVVNISVLLQGRIKGGGNGGNCPGSPAARGPPRDEIYLFQIKYSFEKFS